MKIFKIQKKHGKFRKIYAPSGSEKEELKILKNELLTRMMKTPELRSPYSHGFLKGTNAVTCAKPHIGKKFTVMFDIQDCFDSVTPDMIDISAKKAHIVFHDIENVVKKPGLGDVNLLTNEKTYALCFPDGVARQGLPTSPLIFEVVFSTVDKLIAQGLQKIEPDIVYTRYADNLYISFNDYNSLPKIKDVVRTFVTRYRFKLNDKKTKIMTEKRGRVICSISVTNNGLRPTRYTRRRLRALSHVTTKLKKEDKLVLAEMVGLRLKGLKEWASCKVPISEEEKKKKQEILAQRYKELNEENHAWISEYMNAVNDAIKIVKSYNFRLDKFSIDRLLEFYKSYNVYYKYLAKFKRNIRNVELLLEWKKLLGNKLTYFKRVNLPSNEYSDRGYFMVTKDPVYLVGQSEYTVGWGSCHSLSSTHEHYLNSKWMQKWSIMCSIISASSAMCGLCIENEKNLLGFARPRMLYRMRLYFGDVNNIVNPLYKKKISLNNKYVILYDRLYGSVNDKVKDMFYEQLDDFLTKVYKQPAMFMDVYEGYLIHNIPISLWKYPEYHDNFHVIDSAKKHGIYEITKGKNLYTGYYLYYVKNADNKERGE